MTLSVVVLSYNRPEALARSLASVFAQQGDFELEVLVVDNRSARSDDVARVVAAFPRAHFIRQEQNLGYAAGMNVGIRAATGEFLHLTEDDVELAPGFFAAVLPVAAGQRCLVSGLIFETPSQHCMFSGGRLAITSRFVQQLMPPRQADAPYEVEMLLGMMMCGRRELFTQLGGFRAEFFVYFEDAEFCWRARQLGIRLMMVPGARGYHADPGPYVFKPIIEFHKLKNYLAVNLLHMPATPLTMLVLKFFTYTTIRKAIEGRSAGFLLRVWARSLADLPGYLRERRAGASANSYQR